MTYKIVEADANNHRVNIEIGYKCNLGCPYCYLSNVINRQFSEISIDKINSLFQFIKTVNDVTNFSWDLLLTGGEPTLYYKEYTKLLELMEKEDLDNIKVINLITNGLLFNKLLVDKMKSIEKRNKIIIITVSFHITNNRLLKNIKKYITYFSPYNVRILKVVNKKNLKNAFKTAAFLIKYIRKIAKDYFKQDQAEYEYFDNLLKNNLLLFINLQKDVNEFDYNFHKNYKKYLNKLLRKYASENYIKRLRARISGEYEYFGRYGYCKILDRVDQYIKIYPDLRIGGCGFMDPLEWSPKYFKQYTIYDIIKDPTILEDSYYTDYGRNLVKKYARISYELSKTLGYDVKTFVYCPKRALIYNKSKLGPYPLELLKAYALINQD